MSPMQRRETQLARDQRGAALLTAIVIIGLLSALAAAYAVNVRAALNLRGGMAERRAGFYAAEAGLNVGIARFANIFGQHGIPKDIDYQQELYLGKRTAEVALAPVAGCSPCELTQIPQGEVFGGLNTVPYRYTVQSNSFVHDGESQAHVAGEFDIHNIPIFQFLAFIDGHLFIMPAPNMTLHGRIHTNSDLHIQPDKVLQIEDDPPEVPNVQVTAGGDVYRGGYKYNDSWRCWGNAYVDKLEDTVAPPDDLDPMEMSCAGTSPLPDNVLEGWKGTVKSRVKNIFTPSVGVIGRGDGEYWKRADLRVVLRRDMPGASIDFSAADLCPGGWGALQSPTLSVIEVQGADGIADPGRTRALWRFMCERRGALFYTDVPNNPPAPPNNNWQFAADRNNYTPAFATDGRVYRRVGEDTSGDGQIDLQDSNSDICPAGNAGDPAPWWIPASCPWENATPGDSSWFADMDYRRGGFWNHREAQWMYLLNLNIRALIEWNEVNGDPLFPHDDTSDGGLVIFLSVQGVSSDAGLNNYGVRIFDAADLDTRNATFPTGVGDPTGLSIVSDQAILVEGNYNKNDKYPAAILGDAIWILSQGWEVPVGGAANDLKSVFNLNTGNRKVPGSDSPGGPSGRGSFSGPSDLMVNAAFLFGLGPSTRNPDWYNGGLENFPRFLESWNSRTFNYRGSFVSLGEPQHKLNNWACGSGSSCNGTGVYDPPVRAYDYDADFNQVENLPPLTPKVVYVQQRIFTRIYH